MTAHCGLHVNVMNRSGRPNLRTYDIASWRGLPTYVDGNIVKRPISLTLQSFNIASRKCMYSSDRDLA